MTGTIRIVGARTHNLKNVSCEFPHDSLTVVTGVSGSGKSSLAFDTLYAEGQRRYVESLSAYARQFLERMPRPDLDSIEGVQPAIALEQKNGVRSARSTVGSATEIHDYLRLLFARLGETFCPDCERPVRVETPDSAMRALADLPEGSRALVLAPVEFGARDLSPSLRAELVRAGYFRLWDGANTIDIEAGEQPRDSGSPLAILVDRVVLRPDSAPRTREALRTAFQAGKGRAAIVVLPSRESDAAPREFRFSANLACDGCGRSFPDPQPALFSFHSPLGACPECEGYGRTMEIDFDKVIPNPALSIDADAIAPWNGAGNRDMYDHLRATTTPRQIPRDTPIRDFTPAQRGALADGVGKFVGIRGFFAWLESKKYKVQARVMLARYRAYRTCTACGGARLRPEALNVRLFGPFTIADLVRLPVRELLPLIEGAPLDERSRTVADRVLGGLLGRLRYLDRVGLDYLTLDRPTRTLSGGESQRINLATALGAGLTRTLYVLDEPTVGLHDRDTRRLVSVLESLRDLGNTVVVVEHDVAAIRAADRVLEIGPEAGERGGRVLFEGAVADLEKLDTPTGLALRADARPSVPSRGRKPSKWIVVRNARGNNLRGIDARIPLGVLCCVTGVSGSGKTTLTRDTFAANFRRLRDTAAVDAEPCDGIDGLDAIRALHQVDQTPLARSTRSNPATFVKAYDAIRATLSADRAARAAGLTARDFSFNVDGGRCPVCQGAGVQTIDMQFMADVEVACEACDGKRFSARVLEYRFRGKNIDEILAATADEATEFFREHPKIVRTLSPLREVGLGYLRLGQSTTTLSGGEAQRLKLAAHLARIGPGGRGETFLFDEPTTGLHSRDVERLLRVFQDLVDRGCSVLVVEHNLDAIAAADWAIDLGPEGGDRGGEIVAEGPPEAIAREPRSVTGASLRERFGDALAPHAARAIDSRKTRR